MVPEGHFRIEGVERLGLAEQRSVVAGTKACLDRSEAATHLSTLFLVIAAPDAEVLLGGDGIVKALGPDRALGADRLRPGDLLDRRTGDPNGEEDGGIEVAAVRHISPRGRALIAHQIHDVHLRHFVPPWSPPASAREEFACGNTVATFSMKLCINLFDMSNFLSDQSEPLLSIGALSERTGVPTPTLRSWESRYGFPVSTRLDGGHRRYGHEQIELVIDVAGRRAAGASMAAAIEGALGATLPVDRSFYAALRGASEGLRPCIMRKPALSALTAAFEDECMAQAQRPVLFGAFQRGEHYRASGDRWREMARTAGGTAVFADFAGSASAANAGPVEIHLAGDSPVLREWVLVCDAPGFSACVAGWELPSSPGTPDEDRRFETVWTVDPQTVRRATLVGISLIAQSDPTLASTLTASLAPVDAVPSPALLRANALFNRVVEYVSRSADRQARAS